MCYQSGYFSFSLGGSIINMEKCCHRLSRTEKRRGRTTTKLHILKKIITHKENTIANYSFITYLIFFSGDFRAPSQYPKRRLSVRSRKVSKPRDLYLKLSDRSEIWQALRQHCCRCACQIAKRCGNLNYQSRGFETSRDLTIRRLIGYWNGALFTNYAARGDWTSLTQADFRPESW